MIWEYEMEYQTEELLIFFKALADANRLKIVGLLAQNSHSVEDLAALLGLSSSTVSHHLSRLSDAGLVSAKAEGYYSVYSLQTKTLEDMAQRILSREVLPSVAPEVNPDEYDRNILKNFLLPDGRIKAIPAQLKKAQVIFRYLVNQFEYGKQYTEKEVNAILENYHEDYASLRRALIEEKLMAREGGGGLYWRIPESKMSVNNREN
jgi:predicted transcriptional regulator